MSIGISYIKKGCAMRTLFLRKSRLTANPLFYQFPLCSVIKVSVLSACGDWKSLCGIVHMFVLYSLCYGFVVVRQRAANRINICGERGKRYVYRTDFIFRRT